LVGVGDGFWGGPGGGGGGRGVSAGFRNKSDGRRGLGSDCQLFYSTVEVQ
jgi:hypothetical protein